LKYPNFEKDLERTIFLQRVAFEIVKLQNESGLSLDNFAQQVDLPKSHISRLQSGEHNPTILTLLDMAERCGYEVDIKFKFKK
jgi:xre family toxin-antitoxin system, antitoxin component